MPSFVSPRAKRSRHLLTVVLVAIAFLFFGTSRSQAGFWNFRRVQAAPLQNADSFELRAPVKPEKPSWTATQAEIKNAMRRIFVGPRRSFLLDPCRSISGSVILATLQNQTMYLCSASRTEKSFEISIGAGGAGKTAEGDGKTPVGTYDVQLWQSPGYGEVLYVGYPNADERAKGYSGSQILIHGPSLDMSRDLLVLENYLAETLGQAGKTVYESAASRLRNKGLRSVNWTSGCLAVTSDKDLQDIVRFANRPEHEDLQLVVVAPRGAP